MAGRRGLRAAALGVVLAVAIGVVPVGASARGQSVSVIAADAMTTTLTRSATGVQREVGMPGLAALGSATTPQQVRAALRQHLQSLGSAVAEPRPSDGPLLYNLNVVGDLDGDRRADLVLTEYVDGTLQYVAAAGDTGRTLWKADGPAADHYLADTLALPLHEGDGGGALLVSSTYDELSSSDAAWSLKITIDLAAMAGDGTTLWTRTMSGVVSFSESGTLVGNLSYPLAVGPLNGEGDDVVVRTDDVAYSFVAGGTSRLEVLDGQTGRVGAVVEAVSQEDRPASNVVGDLDGDGLLDIVTASSGNGEVMVVAWRGADGRPLWRSSYTGTTVNWIDPAGRADGDDVEDFLLIGFDWEGEQSFVLVMASGADGTPQWSSSSDGVVSAGDINGDDRNDLLLLDVVDSWSRFGVNYQGVTGAGKKLYDKTYAVAIPKGSSMAMLSIGDFGDIDGDGSVDFAHDISAFGLDKGSSVRERGVIQTRTGRKLHEKLPGHPLYASLDGRGDDTVSLTRLNRGVAITARDGRTADRLWQRDVPLPGYRGGFALAGDLTRDGRAEVILIGRRAGAGSAIRVVDGRSQKMLWGR